jgi:hypothetical protein
VHVPVWERDTSIVLYTKVPCASRNARGTAELMAGESQDYGSQEPGPAVSVCEVLEPRLNLHTDCDIGTPMDRLSDVDHRIRNVFSLKYME